ncbi:unnamed protein product, partial [Effrenium voratum]
TLRVQTENRDGSTGVAQQGLGGYMTDVPGKLREDFLQVKRAHPMRYMRGQEVFWRPGRKVCSEPFPIEPEKLTDRPPFIHRKGSWVPRQASKVPDKFDAK